VCAPGRALLVSPWSRRRREQPPSPPPSRLLRRPPRHPAPRRPRTPSRTPPARPPRGCGPRNRKQVALTFHGQGDLAVATAVLDVLAAHQAIATVMGVAGRRRTQPRPAAPGHHHEHSGPQHSLRCPEYRLIVDDARYEAEGIIHLHASFGSKTNPTCPPCYAKPWPTASWPRPTCRS